MARRKARIKHVVNTLKMYERELYVLVDVDGALHPLTMVPGFRYARCEDPDSGSDYLVLVAGKAIVADRPTKDAEARS